MLYHTAPIALQQYDFEIYSYQPLPFLSNDYVTIIGVPRAFYWREFLGNPSVATSHFA